MTGTFRTILSVPLGLITVVAIIALVAPDSQGQTEPPTFGIGNWTVSDVTVVEDDFVLMDGNVTVKPGGDLTLRNVTILFMCEWSREHGLSVRDGGTLRIENSTLGSTRLRVKWTFYASGGSTLRILDSMIQECGGFTMGTTDSIIERNDFKGGGIGLCPDAPPVRNCTFSGGGVFTSGTWVVDCTFVGGTYGIRVVGEIIPRIIRCTFRDIIFAGVRLGSKNLHGVSLGGAVIIDCSFEYSRWGVWSEGGCRPSIIENCTFERVENAVSIANGSLEIVNGRFFNCTQFIDSHEDSRIDWTVTERAIAVGGSISLSGDLVLRDGARLDCIDCIELAQWNVEAIPRNITLGKGSTLKLVRTALRPPEQDVQKKWIPSNCLPLVIQGDEATLSLVDVRKINLSFPLRLGNLSCRDSRLPLGSWTVQYIDLADSLLYADPAGGEAMIRVTGRLGPTGQLEAGHITRCELDGIPSNGPWLNVSGGRLICRETLYDLPGWLATGGIRLPVSEDVASIESYWSMKVKVVWQSQVPIPSQTVVITDGEGSEHSVVTGPDGTAYATNVLTEVALAAARVRSLLPFTYSVNMSGLTGERVLEKVSGPIEIAVLVRDLIVPTLMVDQGRFLATNRSTYTITGRASDAHTGLAFIEVAIQPDLFHRVDVAPENGTFSFEVELSQLYQTLYIRAYDWVGNRAVWSLVIHYSQREPFLTIYEPVNGSWVNTDPVLIVGVTDPNSTVEVGGRLQHTENGTFMLLVPLVDGLNILSVLSTNLAGNSIVMSLKLFLDTDPPLLEILEPLDKHHYTESATGVISGRAEPGSTVLVNTVELLMDEDGGFSAKTSLDQGPTLFIVQAIDGAGNKAVAEIVFVLDSVPPDLSVVFPPEDGLRTNRTSVTLELSTDMVTEKDGKPTGDILTVNGDAITVTGSEVRVVLELVEGVNEVAIRVTDAMGNLQEVTRMVWVDTTPPALELVGEYPHATTDAYLTVGGRTEPGTIVTVNGLHTQVEDNGTFSLTVLLGSGTNIIDIVAEDAFGNNASVEVRTDMMPAGPEPNESEVAWYPILLVIAAVVLVAEGIFLKRRSKGAEKEAR